MYENDENEGPEEPSPIRFAHWLEEQYVGDDRFESVEVVEPGPIEGEMARVKFICNAQTHFFVSVLEEDGLIRLGLATENRALNEAIETASNENGESLTEFLEEIMDAEDELEHEVQHFEDEAFYYCCEIPYQHDEDLLTNPLRDEVIYYLDGYMTGLFDTINEVS